MSSLTPHTLFPRLPTSAPTPRPLHHQPSASRHPIIYILRSRCPNHLNLPRLTTSATLDFDSCQIKLRYWNKIENEIKVRYWKYIVANIFEKVLVFITEYILSQISTIMMFIRRYTMFFLVATSLGIYNWLMDTSWPLGINVFCVCHSLSQSVSFSTSYVKLDNFPLSDNNSSTKYGSPVFLCFLLSVYFWFAPLLPTWSGWTHLLQNKYLFFGRF